MRKRSRSLEIKRIRERLPLRSHSVGRKPIQIKEAKITVSKYSSIKKASRKSFVQEKVVMKTPKARKTLASNITFSYSSKLDKQAPRNKSAKKEPSTPKKIVSRVKRATEIKKKVVLKEKPEKIKVELNPAFVLFTPQANSKRVSRTEDYRKEDLSFSASKSLKKPTPVELAQQEALRSFGGVDLASLFEQTTPVKRNRVKMEAEKEKKENLSVNPIKKAEQEALNSFGGLSLDKLQIKRKTPKIRVEKKKQDCLKVHGNIKEEN